MHLGEFDSLFKDYFDTLYTQDLALFDRVFHDGAVLYSQQDGQTVVRPFAEYRRILQGRAAPAEKNVPRDETVLMIDRLSDSMAVAKVRLRLFDNIMEDHLSIMKTGKGWQIFAKVFYRAGSAV